MIPAIAALITAMALIIGNRFGKTEYLSYPVTLGLMPFFYVIFAVIGDTTKIVFNELVIAIPFITIAIFVCIIKFKWSFHLLAVGWLLHGIYDFYHHYLFINAGTPTWFGVYCGIVDVVVAIYLVYLAKSYKTNIWQSLKH